MRFHASINFGYIKIKSLWCIWNFICQVSSNVCKKFIKIYFFVSKKSICQYFFTVFHNIFSHIFSRAFVGGFYDWSLRCFIGFNCEGNRKIFWQVSFYDGWLKVIMACYTIGDNVVYGISWVSDLSCWSLKLEEKFNYSKEVINFCESNLIQLSTCSVHVRTCLKFLWSF